MIFLETALCNLKDEILETGYFNTFYEYAELIERGKDRFPQVYTGNGQYKAIYNFDINGTGYIRKNGQSQINVISDSRYEVSSCQSDNPLINITMPLKLVAAVPKSKTSDSTFSDDALAMDIVAIINRRQAGITNIQNTTGIVSGYSTDRDRIWSNEVRGVDKTVDLRLSFISIDFNLLFTANIDCISQDCTYG